MSQDVRVMVPRVRRALEGAGAPPVLTDDTVKDLVADALANVILYTGSAFGKTISVTADDSGVPTEYAVDPDLTLPEQGVIAAQAALDYFFHEFSNVKVSEEIADEAQTWRWSKSAQLLTDQLRLLISQRDKALEAIEATGGLVLDSYASFLAVRDQHTSQLVEPWVSGYLSSGQEDYRFGTLG